MFKIFKNLISAIIFFIFLLEIVAYSLSKFDNTEIFNIRSFTEKTNDKRLYTLKKNFFSKETELDGINKKDWEIYTSENGFRIGKNNNIKLEKDKFIFIGDSVPFGWGLNHDQTLPFFFQKMNQELTVLNGAIPSYSLNQSVERFFTEFSKIKNIKYVYLQIYAPAPIYAQLGNKWHPGDNWTTISKYIFRNYNYLNFKIPLYGEPYILSFIKKKIYRIKIKKLTQQKINSESNRKFTKFINKDLNRLNNFLKDENITLILSSINIPNDTLVSLDKQNTKSIELLNSSFLNFAKNNKNVKFFDLSNEFHQNNSNYIDKCCHLSKKGSSIMAKELNLFYKN